VASHLGRERRRGEKELGSAKSRDQAVLKRGCVINHSVNRDPFSVLSGLVKRMALQDGGVKSALQKAMQRLANSAFSHQKQEQAATFPPYGIRDSSQPPLALCQDGSAGFPRFWKRLSTKARKVRSTDSVSAVSLRGQM
jgi:hypothetical protein